MSLRPAEPDLHAATEHPHERALATLGGHGGAPLAGVRWTSVHLDAVERVLYPVVLRHVPAARRRVRAQLDADRRLRQALWQLNRQLTSAQAQVRTSVQLLLTRVRSGLAEHTGGERALLAELRDATDSAQQDTLAARLLAVTAHAHTPPHPESLQRRAAGGPVSTARGWADQGWAVEGWADRVRDGTARPSVPTHRRHPTPTVATSVSHPTAAPRRAKLTSGTGNPDRADLPGPADR